MTSGLNVPIPVARLRTATRQPELRAGGWYAVVSRLFAGKGVSEAIATRIHFDARPETVWNQIMFYEEVPGRPPFLLRRMLPRPVRTEGEKVTVGGIVQCTYEAGALIKRVTVVQPPHLVQFEVIEQNLGIERCISALGGSYEIRRAGDGAEVILTTHYRAFLHPRRVWRPLEGILASQLHRHIMNGMRARFPAASPVTSPAAAECLIAEGTPSGGLACPTSQSRSPR